MNLTVYLHSAGLQALLAEGISDFEIMWKRKLLPTHPTQIWADKCMWPKWFAQDAFFWPLKIQLPPGICRAFLNLPSEANVKYQKGEACQSELISSNSQSIMASHIDWRVRLINQQEISLTVETHQLVDCSMGTHNGLLGLICRALS